MLGTQADCRGGVPLLAEMDDGPHAATEAVCDRLRRLVRIAALVAGWKRVEDVERAMPDVLSLVPARVVRLVEVPTGGQVVVTAAWPDTPRDAPQPGSSPASASLQSGTPLWLESPDAIAAHSAELGQAASLLGVFAWGAVPLSAGPVPAALELGLAAPPRLDATEKGYLAVAATLIGGAILRVRAAQRKQEVAQLALGSVRRAGELESVIDLFPVGVLLVSRNGKIERMNSFARELYGLNQTEAGPGVGDVLERLAVEWPDGRPITFAESAFARAWGGEVVRDELHTFQPLGGVRRWVLVSAVPLEREGVVQTVVVSLVDVTRAREIELERQELLRHLFRELAPPVKAIGERAQRIRDGDVEKASTRAAEIVRAVRGMTSNLRELEAALRFDVRSVMATHPELVDVKASMLDLLERLGAEVDVARVILSLPPGLPRAHVDPDHLERILVDLIRGALAGAPGMDVGVICAVVEGRFRITVASREQDIAPEDLPRVFERFFRARGRPAGRLYLVRSLIEANRGRVRAESGPARGLAIHVDLPLRPS